MPNTSPFLECEGNGVRQAQAQSTSRLTLLTAGAPRGGRPRSFRSQHQPNDLARVGAADVNRVSASSRITVAECAIWRISFMPVANARSTAMPSEAMRVTQPSFPPRPLQAQHRLVQADDRRLADENTGNLQKLPFSGQGQQPSLLGEQVEAPAVPSLRLPRFHLHILD